MSYNTCLLLLLINSYFAPYTSFAICSVWGRPLLEEGATVTLHTFCYYTRPLSKTYSLYTRLLF